MEDNDKGFWRVSPFAQNKGNVAELQLDLPRGNYRVTWVDTKNGATVKQETLKHAGGVAKLSVPVYKDDIALSIKIH